MSTSDAPPTYFKTNKFTRGYQAIVEAYGVADYGEVNPSRFTELTMSLQLVSPLTHSTLHHHHFSLPVRGDVW